MRFLISVLCVSIPLCAGTLQTSASCPGSYVVGTDSASCETSDGTGASATAGLYVGAKAWTGVSGDSSSASASFVEYYLLTVTGGYGMAYAAPLLYVGGDAEGDLAQAWGSASLGDCQLRSYGGGSPPPCDWSSIKFEFGTPLPLTLSESAGASGGPYGPTREVDGSAFFSGFAFFDLSGNPLSGINYDLSVTDPPPAPTPEPGMSPLFAAMACAVLTVFRRRRRI